MSTTRRQPPHRPTENDEELRDKAEAEHERRTGRDATEAARNTPAESERLAPMINIENVNVVEEELIVEGGGGGSRGGGNGGPGGPPDRDRPDGTPRRPYTVRLAPSSEDPLFLTELALWEVIAQSTYRLSFPNYANFLDEILIRPEGEQRRDSILPRPYSVYGSDAYDLVKCATTVFMMQEAGRLGDLNWIRRGSPGDAEVIATIQRDYAYLVTAGEAVGRTMPYLDLIRQKLAELPIKTEFALGTGPQEYGILRGRLDTPTMTELIWSYWLEWGMLVQSVNAIALRFQNKRLSQLPDPLSHLTLDPLRPLANLLWGWVQDEVHRLTVGRRAYEYDHQYGLTLTGTAVPEIKSVDRRSRFIEAFHNLLRECIRFFRERDDLTVRADGFTLLNSINDVHLLLAEGEDNQFGDLPWVARQEMMITQWLLARPEFREFLGGRIMVPYTEPWMDRVDTMRALQKWGDVSITSFGYLAQYGEQILLTLRYGNWSRINDAGTAAAWADRWRAAIQSYVHHYRRVTGVDLGADILEGREAQDRYAQPGALIIRRLSEQRGVPLPAPASLAALPEPTRIPTRRLPRPAHALPQGRPPGANGR